MLISALLGLVASLVLSVEAISLATDPYGSLGCDLSAKISCSVVGLSWQANLLGFPNAFFGLIAEPVVITVAVAALGGVRFPRWFLLTAQAVYFVGFAFAYWLFVQAYIVIGALCPWCLLITVTTTLVFASLTRVNLLDAVIRLPGRWHDRAVTGLRYGMDVYAVVVWFAVLTALVIVKYL